MHRVLQPLHELLELSDSRLKRPKAILSMTDAGRLLRLINRVGTAPNSADPRDESIKLAHTSPPAWALGRNRAARIPPTLFLCHLADHQRTALDLLTHQFELRLALLLGSPPCTLHLVTSLAAIETIPFGQPGPCLGFLASRSRRTPPSALTT
jgi:hypothetical protein